MRLDEFDYPLPTSLIAQYPSAQRGASLLMVVHRRTGQIEHRVFQDLLNYLHPGDLLVINNTRVLPARLFGRKETGGKIEILLTPSWNGTKGEWKALIKGGKKIKKGTRLRFDQGIEGEIQEIKDGKGEIRFFPPLDILEILKRIGHIPLPPYIRRKDEPSDQYRYQTIFAEKEGSIAAPTAGLHFTSSILESLKEKGVYTATITLHIGIGTFTPVKSEEVKDHILEAEWVEITEETARLVREARARGGKIFAVGTTTTRALESFSNGKGGVTPAKGMSGLFIYPPYEFRVIDGLITNFHLPKSTLIMLVSAFAGKDLLRKAYQEAIEKRYHFYSYGDTMLIL